jgi:hypothetical protein
MRRSPLAQLSDLRNFRLRRAEADAFRQAHIVAGARQAENQARIDADKKAQMLNVCHSELLEEAKMAPLTRAMLDARRDTLAVMEDDARGSELRWRQAGDFRKTQEEQLRTFNLIRFERSKAAEALEMMIRRATMQARKKAEAAEEERQEENVVTLLRMGEGRR